jgi:hypothetical protein
MRPGGFATASAMRSAGGAPARPGVVASEAALDPAVRRLGRAQSRARRSGAAARPGAVVSEAALDQAVRRLGRAQS